MTKINSKLRIRLYKALLEVRRSEEILADEYRNGTMKTPTHFGIGQEAIAVGVCEGLKHEDVVYTHHRSHTHYLAKGGDPLGLFAELLGRIDGCSKGRGGSVHLIDRKVNFLGSSPILGHSLALATGTALAFKMDNKPNIAVAFFGEGAFDEGVVWESLNYAAIHKLPVVFVCENNLYATESPLSVRMPAGTDLCERVRSFNIPAQRVDGNNVEEVYSAAKSIVEDCRNGSGPFFIECMTYRWREHVGPLWDYEVNRTFRTKEELLGWIKKCPVVRIEKNLLVHKDAEQKDINRWKEEIDRKLESVLKDAFASEWPDASTLFENK